ncbi:hypothetical protein TNCV_1206531 [Trichonephila clavipes]|nr:hypothetical protein TNCV_1206531 [Trichonephila clavipes]
MNEFNSRMVVFNDSLLGKGKFFPRKSGEFSQNVGKLPERKHDLSSNPGERIDVCKYFVSSRNGGTLKREASSRWRKGMKGGRPLTTLKVFSVQIGVEISQNVLGAQGYG